MSFQFSVTFQARHVKQWSQLLQSGDLIVLILMTGNFFSFGLLKSQIKEDVWVSFFRPMSFQVSVLILSSAGTVQYSERSPLEWRYLRRLLIHLCDEVHRLRGCKSAPSTLQAWWQRRPRRPEALTFNRQLDNQYDRAATGAAPAGGNSETDICYKRGDWDAAWHRFQEGVK